MKFVSVFTFVVLATVVAGQDTIGGCFNKFVDQTEGKAEGSSDACPSMKAWVKCIWDAKDKLDHADGVKEFFQRSQNALNITFGTFGHGGCSFDFSEIFGEETKDAGSTKATDTETVGGCLLQFWDHWTTGGYNDSAFCGFVEEYEKCVMKAKDVEQVDGVKELFKKSESAVKSQLKGFVGCEIEFTYGTGQDIIGGCFNKFILQTEGKAEGSSGACPSIKDWVKCIWDAKNNLEHADGVKEFFQKSQNALNITFAHDGCSFDFSEIFGEKTKDAGSTMATDTDTVGGCLLQFWNHWEKDVHTSYAFCGYVEEYEKCVMKAKDVQVDGVKELFKKSESAVKIQLQGVARCDVEFTYGNAGSTTPPIGWLLVTVTSLLVMVQQL